MTELNLNTALTAAVALMVLLHIIGVW